MIQQKSLCQIPLWIANILHIEQNWPLQNLMQFEKVSVTPVIDNTLKHCLEKLKTKIYIPEIEEWKKI